MSIEFQDGKLNETALDFEERLCVAAHRLLSGYWDPYLGDEPIYCLDVPQRPDYAVIPYKSIISDELISIVGKQKFDLVRWQLWMCGTEQEWIQGRVREKLKSEISEKFLTEQPKKEPRGRCKRVADCKRFLKGLLFFALGILCAHLLQL